MWTRSRRCLVLLGLTGVLLAGAAALLIPEGPARGASRRSGTHHTPDRATAPTRPSNSSPQEPAARDGSARSPTARVRYVVAAIGDSITDHRSHGGKYLDYLQKRCPQSRFDDYGVGGQMVNQMRRRFERDVLGKGVPHNKKPTYTDVIIFGGVNDLYSDLTAGRTVPKIEKDLSFMYRLAREHHLRVIAITVSPWGGFRRYYNQRRGCNTLRLNAWIASRPAAGEVDIAVDSYSLLSCGNPERLCDRYARPFRDGIHFGKEGHELLGKALFEAAFRDCR